MSCLKTIKVANSFALTLVDGEGNALKSGSNKQDVLSQVLDFMFEKCNGKPQVEEDEKLENEDDTEFMASEVTIFPPDKKVRFLYPTNNLHKGLIWHTKTATK